jgi:hypothetical protein
MQETAPQAPASRGFMASAKTGVLAALRALAFVIAFPVVALASLSSAPRKRE